MNQERRTKIDKALALMADAKAIIEEVLDEEQEAYDNMPEGLQTSERGEAMQEAITNLEDANSSVDEIEDYLEDAKGE
tara:strand:+ start:131 stop:364 length:234 start_codon:yes stop_codon:yes gene_type:complete